ncbi:MAG TPA: BON domain-containing protein [Steroidobacteraceae bacterium]|nr:BON domain-containing protein [Steroidobacteraceae bacterium]
MCNRPDGDIRQHVEAELYCCPDLDETDIAVKVTDGAVTLTGYARHLLDKYAAEDAAKRVPGVAAVANDIQVQAAAAGTSDPEIARAALAAIRRSVPRCCARIRPVVRQGIVTLEGTVDAEQQRDVAVRAVRDLKGVVCVVNSIAVASEPAQSEPGGDAEQIRTDPNGRSCTA